MGVMNRKLKGGNRCSKAQVYPPALCRAICKGAAREREYRSRGLFAVGVVDVESGDPLSEKQFEGEYEPDMPCSEDEVEACGG